MVWHDANVNEKDKESKTALHYAAERGSFEIVRYLVWHDANVNEKDKESKTALHYAAKSGSFEIVRYLVWHDANVNEKDKESKTALHYAAERGSFEIVRYLVCRGANVNEKDKESRTALHYAAERGSSEIVLDLVCLCANVNEKDEESKTALHYAAECSSFEIVKYLVCHGANVSEKDKESKTALHYAAECGSSEIVKFLVEHGADADGKDERNSTVFYYADLRDTLETDKEYNAVGNARNKAIKSVLHYAGEWLPLEMMGKDEKRNAAPRYAIGRGSLETLKYLGERGTDVNEKGDVNRSALNYAAKQNSFENVEYLIEHIANERNKHSDTALNYGSCQVVKYLFDHGADDEEESMRKTCRTSFGCVVRGLQSKVESNGHTRDPKDFVRGGDGIINLLKLGMSVKHQGEIRLLKAMDDENLRKVIYFYCCISP